MTWSAESRAKLSASTKAMHARRRAERGLPPKQDPVAQPCACGCGQLAGPGNRVILGHGNRAAARRKGVGTPGQGSVKAHGRAMSETLTVACGHCDWSQAGPAGEVLAAQAKHKLEHTP